MRRVKIIATSIGVTLALAQQGGSMKHVVLVGLDPATVDFADPALPLA
jgi:hypothetical protein